ncbi:hypothetical protein Efla_007771 [Eimeria flavescens]
MQERLPPICLLPLRQQRLPEAEEATRAAASSEQQHQHGVRVQPQRGQTTSESVCLSVSAAGLPLRLPASFACRQQQAAALLQAPPAAADCAQLQVLVDSAWGRGMEAQQQQRGC